MQRSTDRSFFSPPDDSFLSSYNNKSKSSQPKHHCEHRKSSPLYHSLERAAALYQHHRCRAHMQSWDSRVYHSPSRTASKRPNKSSQRCPRHANGQHDASLCCCFAGVLHSCSVHCSESLAEELEVATLLQVPIFAYMLPFCWQIPLFCDISLEMNHTKASVLALEFTLACLITHACKLCVLGFGCLSGESVCVGTCLICASTVNPIS